MGNIAVSTGHKIVYRATGKAKKEKRDGLVDSPNDEIGMYGLYLEEIMSKARKNQWNG